MRRFTMALVVAAGILEGPGCALDDSEVQEEEVIGSSEHEVTVQCGGRNYLKLTKTCNGYASNGQPLSPYQCRLSGVSTQGSTGLPNAYYLGPCEDGQYTQRIPHYYDQFVQP